MLEWQGAGNASLHAAGGGGDIRMVFIEVASHHHNGFAVAIATLVYLT